LQVTFSEELPSVKFTITGPNGATLVDALGTIDLSERTNATIALKNGQYTVVWHNVSATTVIRTMAAAKSPHVAGSPPAHALAGRRSAPTGRRIVDDRWLCGDSWSGCRRDQRQSK